MIVVYIYVCMYVCMYDSSGWSRSFPKWKWVFAMSGLKDNQVKISEVENSRNHVQSNKLQQTSEIILAAIEWHSICLTHLIHVSHRNATITRSTFFYPIDAAMCMCQSNTFIWCLAEPLKKLCGHRVFGVAIFCNPPWRAVECCGRVKGRWMVYLG